MKSKMIKSVLLCLMVLFISAVPALADAWIPPDDNYNDALMSCPYEDGECKGLNTFLSNYAESNVYYYGIDSPDSVVIAGALKHIELNGKAEETFIVDSGSRYMSVKASVFEDVCDRYFGRTVSASSCPGYKNGRIVVSAANYKAPLNTFASSVYCSYEGNYQYTVSFEVYRCEGNAQDYYGVARNNLPSGVKKIGEGECAIDFSGKQTSFKSSDFRLKRISMTNNAPQYDNVNTQYIEQDQITEDVVTEDIVTEEAVTPSIIPEGDNANTKTIDSGRGSERPIVILLTAICIVLLSALTAALILLFYKKK